MASGNFSIFLSIFLIFNILVVHASTSNSSSQFLSPLTSHSHKNPSPRSMLGGMFGDFSTWISDAIVGLILWACGVLIVGIVWGIWYYFFYGNSGGLYGWNYAGGGSGNGGYPFPIPRPPYGRQSADSVGLIDWEQISGFIFNAFEKYYEYNKSVQ